MRLGLASVAVCVVLAASAVAQSSAGPETAFARPGQDRSGVDTAFARTNHLRHGINASEWFAQSADYSAAHTDRYTDAQDIALMAKLGFDHVRLSIDADALDQAFSGRGKSSADFLPRLDRAVDAILANGLAIEIDVHPSDAYKQQLRSGDDQVERFTALWRKLAAHYADRDPERVFFEILNEPEVERCLPLGRHPGARGRGHPSGCAAQHAHRRRRQLLKRARPAPARAAGRRQRDLQLPLLPAARIHAPRRNLGRALVARNAFHSLSVDD